MAVSPIPRTRIRSSFSAWLRHMPKPGHVHYHLQRIIEAAPPEWQPAIRARFLSTAPTPPAGVAMDPDAYARWYLGQPSESEQAWLQLQALADYEDRYGDALRLNMGDGDICAWASKLADDVEELENRCIAMGGGLQERLAMVRSIVALIGVDEGQRMEGEPAIARAKCARWWRRRLRRHIARVVEAGAISMGLVHLNSGGYVSHSGLKRRKGQLARNAGALGRTFYRNEAGQIYSLAELSALSTSNPAVRGGELMTRIRGAEEYAQARGHVGLFLTLTLPSKYHARRLMGSGSNRWTVRNPKHNGASPRDGQQWMLAQWKRVLARLDRQKVKRYGLRVVEPHHDATPHWHMLVWVEGEAQAATLIATIRQYWLSEDADERGAQANRVDVKRLRSGGAAGYVAKYIAKNLGHHALAEHMDVVQGQAIQMGLGLDAPAQPAGLEAKESNGLAAQRRVDAWAATWSIRQFQAFGMPSVTVWRELRRVSKDQPAQIDLFDRATERHIQRACQACHRHGELRADWRLFMESMGGHACKRQDWLLCPGRRAPRPGATNRYGDPLKAGPVRGVEVQRGRARGHWLVSRRIAWTHCTDASHGTADTDGVIQGAGHGPLTRRPLGAAWTGFNNFTARLQGQTAQALFGRGRHPAQHWSDSGSPDSALCRPASRPVHPIHPPARPPLAVGPCHHP